jgi:hypothetical protein
MSGYEPPLDMELWNLKDELRESHNCFAYAMNAVDPNLVKKCKEDPDCNVTFPQPGYASGFKKFSEQRDKGCGDMVSRLWGDNPKVHAVSFEEKCPPGTSKIALIVDPNRDYHFLRQDPDGFWSHKPGAMAVTRLDATDRPIIRPDRACFMYKKHKDPLTYTKFCGYFCVPRTEPIHMMHEVRQEGGASASRRSTRRQRHLRAARSQRAGVTRRSRG